MDNTLLFGHHLEKSPAARPPEAEFMWADAQIPALPAPSCAVILPAPRVDPPEDCSYPVSPEQWTLVQGKTHRRGFSYHAEIATVDGPIRRERLLHTITPPNTMPIRDSITGALSYQPIPGQVEMEVGVPYVQNSDGDFQQTIGGFVTPESLIPFCGEADDVMKWTNRLTQLTFSSPDWEKNGDRRPIYAIPELRRNLRSAKADSDTSYDGSYSLGSTLGEGEGRGQVKPALQTAIPESAATIKETLECCVNLHRLACHALLSKLEISLTEFAMDDNNVFGLCGGNLGATACQMNVACATAKDLWIAIGIWQGWFHTDYKDDKSRWTVAIILTRLLPGQHIFPCI